MRSTGEHWVAAPSPVPLEMRVAALTLCALLAAASAQLPWIKASTGLPGKMVDSYGACARGMGCAGGVRAAHRDRTPPCPLSVRPRVRCRAGRVRLFHGVNAVNKGFPWYWTDFLENPQHIDDLEAWGASVPPPPCLLLPPPVCARACAWRNRVYVRVVAATWAVCACARGVAGVNFVRLGWMWSGAEPAPQSFNMTYFEITANIVTQLAARGIYTMLDMHGLRAASLPLPPCLPLSLPP